jgi:hypothetical protein
LREHLLAAQANPLAKSGPRHESLDVPPLPPLCRGVWRIFTELHQRRGGSFGPAPIDEARLLAWCQLYGRQLSEWEINSIFAIDACWLNAQAEANQAQNSQAQNSQANPKNTAEK